MDNLTDSVAVLFQKAQVEGILENQKQVNRWVSYREEIIQVEERLKLFLKDFTVAVLVPIGNKALLRGKLVHTNDVLISLGDGYFVKGSVEQALRVISKRVANCDDVLHRLHKERELLESRTNLPGDLLPSPDHREIVEELKEDEEAKWREEHRQKVREYKERLARMKVDKPEQIRTDQDLWKQLDILELEEELNDELDRLSDDSDSSYEASSTDNTDPDETNPSDETVRVETKPVVNLPPPQRSIMKKHCSKTPTHASDNIPPSESRHQFIKIEFKHSEQVPTVKGSKETIDSPTDVYERFNSALKGEQKMGRRVSFAEEPQIKTFERGKESSHPLPDQSSPPVLAFGDVVERTLPSDIKVTQQRPLSRFKASRQHQ